MGILLNYSDFKRRKEAKKKNPIEIKDSRLSENSQLKPGEEVLIQISNINFVGEILKVLEMDENGKTSRISYYIEDIDEDNIFKVGNASIK